MSNTSVVIHSYIDENYAVIHAFCDLGNIEKCLIDKVYESYSSPKSKQSCPLFPYTFATLDDLNRFSFDLCQEIESSKIVVVSVEEYNQAIENIVSFEEILVLLSSCGEVIENLDKSGGKNIWNRFF